MQLAFSSPWSPPWGHWSSNIRYLSALNVCQWVTVTQMCFQAFLGRVLGDQIILPTNFPRPAFKYKIVYLLFLAPDPLSVPPSMPESQSELSQPISNDYLRSIKDCQGNKGCKARKKICFLLIIWNSTYAFPVFTDKNFHVGTTFFGTFSAVIFIVSL